MNHTKQLNRIEKMIEAMANFMMARFEEHEKKLDEKVSSKELDTKLNGGLNNLKLELLDKLAPRYRVDDHELRLQKLESKT